ncbi:small ribosomal subunit rsm22 protein [Cyclospora cayetanensis]|uniref:Small ribosomal subunit rsm22 protein n=1 Tax=Cyclospora cayetanensis TaxID=88456 RepID=A0A1D3CXK3_9EIME|nr:small ribosomal subunit rsm22 protein [Cyclospora cayetanensis]
MLESPRPDAESVAALDSVSLCTLKTVELPAPVLQKLHLLLKHVGRKRDLEKTGRLIADKTTARTSVELPRVLPSQLLPEAQQVLADAAAREAFLEKQHQEEHAEEFPGAAADAAAVTQSRRQEPTASTLLLKSRDAHLLRSLPEATDALLSALPAEGLEAQEALAAAEDARHPLYRHLTLGHSPLTAAAWTAHRFAGVYASLLRILVEGKAFGDVDAIGATVSTASAASLGSSFSHSGESSLELLMAVEPSAHLASVGRYLTADLVPTVQWQLALYDEGLRRRLGSDGEPEDDRFDLVMYPHGLLRSVEGQPSRHAMIRTLWNRLRPGGLLLLVERGTVSGFRVLGSVRELFIAELSKGSFHFVAPCSHESVCPLALTGRDWCHFGQRVRRLPHHLYCKGSRAKAVEEEKFSFLAVRKGQGPRSRYRTLAAAETAGASPAELSFFWPRLVAPPLKGREHVLLDVCAPPHRFERVAVSKHMPHAAGYKAARHAAWGDLWRHPRRIVRPDARAYMEQDLREAADRRHARKAETNARQDVGEREEELHDTLVKHCGA